MKCISDNKQPQKKYLAKLIYKIDLGSTTSNAEFEEQLRVIYALSTEDAFYKSRLIGSQEETNVINENGKMINWKFIDVIDLVLIDDTQHGSELFTTTNQIESPENYINIIKHKAMILQTQALPFV
jgi:Domain of unknown function (DUF4288)